MKKPRTVKRKPKPAPRRPTPALKGRDIIKSVMLPPDGIVRVHVPSGIAPVVAVDPVNKVVVVAPATQADAKQPWWKFLFGKA